jgi:indoleamine 2,3-dioxygenase
MFALRFKPSTIKSLVSRPIYQQVSTLSLRKFSLLTEAQNKDTNQQMFSVGGKNGFLPRQEPLSELPQEFNKLESLLQRMPMQLLDGTPGLLASGQFGDAVRDELPLYEIDGITDQRLLSGKLSESEPIVHFFHYVITYS